MLLIIISMIKVWKLVNNSLVCKSIIGEACHYQTIQFCSWGEKKECNISKLSNCHPSTNFSYISTGTATTWIRFTILFESRGERSFYKENKMIRSEALLTIHISQVWIMIRISQRNVFCSRQAVLRLLNGGSSQQIEIEAGGSK